MKDIVSNAKSYMMKNVDEIEDIMHRLRQVVAVAREAKKRGWSRAGMDKSCIDNNPGELFEYSISEAERMIKEIEKIIYGDN